MQQSNKNVIKDVDSIREGVAQGGSFPFGTRVMTDKGLVEIQDIKVGDQVLSKPASGEGELCYKAVVQTFSYENKEVWELCYCKIEANTNLENMHKYAQGKVVRTVLSR